MHPANLSNYQLYELIQNTKLDQSIRQAANDEFNKRKLPIAEIQQLILRHDSEFISDKEEGLKIQHRILLVVCPFFIEIHSLIAGRMLAKKQNQKWKDYWVYLCLGYLIWTVGIILFAKYYLFRNHIHRV